MVGFKQVAETEQPDPKVVEHPSREGQIIAQTLTLLLKGLSQKALVAISNLFSAAALFSAWWLWNDILPAPSVNQLVGVSLYAVFILAIEIVRRR